MATSQEVLERLIREGMEKGILSEEPGEIPEGLRNAEVPVCEMVNRGITSYCKGNDQLSMIPMLTIQLCAYAGMAACAQWEHDPASLQQPDFPACLTAGRPVEELGTVSWEMQGIDPGSDGADRLDDHIRALYIKALLFACNDGTLPMDQERIMAAAGGMYGYGITLERSGAGRKQG